MGQVNFDLSNKTILVTGAGRGIGRSIAEEAAAFGANLALGSRRVEESESVAKKCRELGVEAKAWHLDISDSASIEKFSELCKPLPPETTILAVPNSGLSDLDSSLPINSTLDWFELNEIFSTVALPFSI